MAWIATIEVIAAIADVLALTAVLALAAGMTVKVRNNPCSFSLDRADEMRAFLVTVFPPSQTDVDSSELNESEESKFFQASLHLVPMKEGFWFFSSVQSASKKNQTDK